MTKNSDEERSTFYIPMNVTNGKVNRKVSEIVAEQIKSTDNVLECACGTGLLTLRIYPLC